MSVAISAAVAEQLTDEQLAAHRTRHRPSGYCVICGTTLAGDDVAVSVSLDSDGHPCRQLLTHVRCSDSQLLQESQIAKTKPMDWASAILPGVGPVLAYHVVRPIWVEDLSHPDQLRSFGLRRASDPAAARTTHSLLLVRSGPTQLSLRTRIAVHRRRPGRREISYPAGITLERFRAPIPVIEPIAVAERTLIASGPSLELRSGPVALRESLNADDTLCAYVAISGVGEPLQLDLASAIS